MMTKQDVAGKKLIQDFVLQGVCSTLVYLKLQTL